MNHNELLITDQFQQLNVLTVIRNKIVHRTPEEYLEVFPAPLEFLVVGQGGASSAHEKMKTKAY